MLTAINENVMSKKRIMAFRANRPIRSVAT
jgi:hypothetical protein